MIWRLLQLDSVLLLVAPILIIFLIALAIDAGVTKSRERKAAEAARGPHRPTELVGILKAH